MFGLMFRVFEHLLVEVCLATLSLVFLGVAVLLRLLPRSFNLVRFCLRGLLTLSFRLYRFLFTHLAPFVQRQLSVDILANPSRMVASFLLSLVLGLLFLVVTHLPVTGWSVGLCLLHGLAVGLAWDEMEEPDGLHLGARVQ